MAGGFQGSALHLNQALTQYAIAWTPPEKGFWLRGEFFPRLDVDKDSNVVRQIDQASLMQIYDAEAGPGGLVKDVSFGIGANITYKCQPYALEGIINYYERAQADVALQYEYRQTAHPLSMLNFKLEKKSIDYLRTAGNYSGQTKTLAAAELWDNYDSTSSSPIDEIIGACEKVVYITGRKVNRIAMDALVWRVIRRHPAVLQAAAVHTTPAGLQIITAEMFEKILGEWVEPGSLRITFGRYANVAQPNALTTSTLKSFIGADVAIAYIEPPSLNGLGFAHEFAFAGLDGNAPVTVYQYDDPKIAPKGGMRVRVMSAVDYKIMRALSGYLLKGVVDTTQAQYSSQL